MNYGVTAEGFKRKTKDRLIKEIEEDFERGIKKSVDWNVRSPMGQLSKLSALKISELWEVAEECYHSLFPDSSEGVNLDNSSSLNGVLRKKPTSTRVPVELKVLDGILDSLREDEQIFIPRGSLVLESSEQKLGLYCLKISILKAHNQKKLYLMSSSRGLLRSSQIYHGSLFPITKSMVNPLRLSLTKRT